MTPALQIFPALDAATEAALRASIERFGVLVPVAITQDGEIIDGPHRSRIAGELGVEIETRVHHVADEAEAREIARTLNEDRRMLTREQRLPVVAALREEGHSYRAIGRALGVSQTQARSDAAGVNGFTPAQRDRLDNPAAQSIDYTKGLDGKTYPATRPRAEPKVDGRSLRRGYRKEKDVPFEAVTERAQQIATGHKQRLADGLSEINGICRGLRDLDLGIAEAACTAHEWKTWITKSGELSRALGDLKKRLTEVGNGKA